MKKILALAALLLVGAAVTVTPVSAVKWSSYRIMLDPGHGGSDPGASGPSAPHEAELALRCSNALVERFKTLGVGYRLTRTSNTSLSLSARKSMSVSYDPYIFCSIHLNAFNGSAHGTETWYYWSTGNSRPLANRVQSQLVANLKRANRGVKQNGWTVITGSSSVPAILTEGLFVDNYTEWSMINNNSNAGFKSWVNGHLYGFYDHLKTFNANIDNPAGGSTQPTPDPVVKVSNSSWSFSAVKGATDAATIKVTGTNTTAAIAVSLSGTNASEFSLSTTSIAKAGGDLKITFKPTSLGSKSAKVTLKSGTASATISLSGTCTAPDLVFVEKWNFSDKNGTATSKGWDATKVRNMTYANGKLYLVYDNSDIKVVKAIPVAADDTGVLGNLNKGNIVSGGTFSLCDVKYCDGKIVACNLSVDPAKSPLKVYVWDNDQSLPTLALETTNFGGAKRLGDCIGWRGTWTSGELVFANDDGSTSRIITYAVTNGKIATTPTVKNATKADGTRLATSSSTRVYPQSSGKYWIDGKDNNTALLDANGKEELYIDQDETWGNALATFKWEDVQYALVTSFNPREGESFSTQTPEQKAKNYTGGGMHLLKCTDGWAKPYLVAKYPANGLSDTRQNTNCTQNVVIKQNGNNVEAWVLSANQGIAYFINKGGTVPSYDYETIKPIATEPTITAPASKELSTEWGSSVSANVNVTGENLKGDINATITGTDASAFSIDKDKLTPTNGAVSGTIKVSFTAAEDKTYTAQLVLTSTDAATVTVKLTGIGQKKVSYASELGTLEQKWIYSTNTNNLGDAAWFEPDAKALARNMAVIDNNLYVLVSKAWGENRVIKLNAETGAQTGTVNLDGVSGGQIIVASVAALGNTLIASNQARPNNSDKLKIYKLDANGGAPTVLLEAATRGDVNLGDHMGTYGDMNNGRIAFAGLSADGTTAKVVWYQVKNGAINGTANEFNIPADGVRSCKKVQPMSDGTFWVTTRHSAPTHYSATGEKIESLGLAKPMIYGTSSVVFDYGSHHYIASATPTGSSVSASYGNVAMTIHDITDGVDQAKELGKYPQAGLGTASWDVSAVIDVAHRLTGNNNSKADFWVMASKQGIAHYSFNGEKTSGVENITVAPADDADAVYYNLQGIRVDKENLAPGVYIRTAGDKTAKVLVR